MNSIHHSASEQCLLHLPKHINFVICITNPQFDLKHKTEQKVHNTVLWSLICQKYCKFKSRTVWALSHALANVLAVNHAKAIQGQHIDRVSSVGWEILVWLNYSSPSFPTSPLAGMGSITGHLLLLLLLLLCNLLLLLLLL